MNSFRFSYRAPTRCTCHSRSLEPCAWCSEPNEPPAPPAPPVCEYSRAYPRDGCDEKAHQCGRCPEAHCAQHPHDYWDEEPPA